MNHPIISVVMCTYNTEKYIAEAIESVLTQSFTDFEFIIWDDGSTDRTRSIVESFKDERIRYFYHENTGLGMALKLACAEAQGKYIARMDSDDICFSERFATEVDFLESHPDHVLVSSAVFYIDEDGKNIGRTFPCSDDMVLKKILPFSSMIIHPMVMMRRNAYERAGGYVPLKKSQDRVFWSRLAKEGKFHNIIFPLGQYRMLRNSLSHNVNPYNRVLYEFRRKMILDDVIQDSDVEWYNNLYNYAKPFSNMKTNEKDERSLSAEERFYFIFSPLFGERLVEKIISNFKNLTYKIRLYNQ